MRPDLVKMTILGSILTQKPPKNGQKREFSKNSNKQQAVKVKVSKGLSFKRKEGLKGLEKLEVGKVGKVRSWKSAKLEKIEVGKVRSWKS